MVAGAVAVAGCGREPGVERATGSVIVGSVAEVAALEAGEVEDLRRAGVREVFLDAGSVRFEQGEPVLAAALEDAAAAARPRLPVVLSIGGGWPRAGEFPPAAGAGALLAERLRELARGAMAAGLAVVGVHLDLDLPSDAEAVEAYGRLVEGVAEELPEVIGLALSLDRATLRSPAAEELVASADLLVPFLFGPRLGRLSGPSSDERWTLQGIEDDLTRLEELGKPYLVGVGIVGGVWRAGEAGEPFTGTRLGALLADGALDARPAPLFAGTDAQIYPFVARRAHRLGEWSLAAGEEIEARRLAAHHLRALLARVEAAGSPLHLGQLYARLPRPGEGLALTPAELAAAHGPAAAAPRLELAGEAPGRGRLRVHLAHRGGGATEVAALDHNYVEVRLAGGAFGAVDPGGFARYELLADGRRAADMATLRRADTLRLYAPYLERGDEVASGPIRHTGTVALSGRFLMPDGTVVEVTAGEGERAEAAPTAGGGS